MEAMLRIRVVAPVSDSVMSAGTAKRDRPTGAGLWSIVASFRADNQATAGNILPRTKGTRGDPRSRHGGSKALSSTDVALSILREHGYPQEIIDFANTRGAEKIMYAGYFPMGLSLDRIFSELPDVPFKDEVWPKFLRENAVRVFDL